MASKEEKGAVEGYAKLGEQKRHELENEVEGLPSDADDKGRAALELAEANAKTEAEKAAQKRLGKLPPLVHSGPLATALAAKGLTIDDVKSIAHEGDEVAIVPLVGPPSRVKVGAYYEPLIERALVYANVRREDLKQTPTVNKNDVEMYVKGVGIVTIPREKLETAIVGPEPKTAKEREAAEVLAEQNRKSEAEKHARR